VPPATTPDDHEVRPAASAAAPQRQAGITTKVEQRDGQPVLVKGAHDAAGCAALTHEARMLTLARHPGVVEVVGLTEHRDDGAELVLRFVSSHTLTPAACRSPEHAAGIVAALAETVADLHHLGIVHGRVEAAHVVLSAAGHPILVGFRRASTAAAVPPPEPRGRRSSADAVEGAAPHRHDDVAALGQLLRDLVLVQPDDGPLIPERRWRRARGDAQDRRALLTLADHATADDPRAQPGARRFAAAILTAVPHATLGAPASDDPARRRPGATVQGPPGRALPRTETVTQAPADVPTGSAAPEPDPDPDPAPALALGPRPGHRGRRPPPRPSSARDGDGDGDKDTDRDTDRARSGRDRDAPAGRRGLPYAIGLVGITSLAFGVASLQHADRPSVRADAAPTLPPTSPADPPPATEVVPAAPTSAPPASAPPAPLRFQPAGVLTHDGHRYTVGAPGDELAVGALTCRPGEQDRVAVLRVASGELFVFDGWADRVQAREAPLAARVVPGSHWLEPADPVCAPLSVLHPDRSTQVVDLPPEGPR
jgi:hypothetical protein